jgi:hypothetical protein
VNARLLGMNPVLAEIVHTGERVKSDGTRDLVHSPIK